MHRRLDLKFPRRHFAPKSALPLYFLESRGLQSPPKFAETLEPLLGTPATRSGVHWRPPTRFECRGWSAYQKRWPADHLAQIRGNFALSHSFLYIHSAQALFLPTSNPKSPSPPSSRVFPLRSALYMRFPTPQAKLFRENFHFSSL